MKIKMTTSVSILFFLAANLFPLNSHGTCFVADTPITLSCSDEVFPNDSQHNKMARYVGTGAALCGAVACWIGFYQAVDGHRHGNINNKSGFLVGAVGTSVMAIATPFFRCPVERPSQKIRKILTLRDLALSDSHDDHFIAFFHTIETLFIKRGKTVPTLTEVHQSLQALNKNNELCMNMDGTPLRAGLDQNENDITHMTIQSNWKNLRFVSLLQLEEMVFEQLTGTLNDGVTDLSISAHGEIAGESTPLKK